MELVTGGEDKSDMCMRVVAVAEVKGMTWRLRWKYRAPKLVVCDARWDQLSTADH